MTSADRLMPGFAGEMAVIGQRYRAAFVAARVGQAGLAVGVIARGIKTLAEETETASAELVSNEDQVMATFQAI
ncbi:MAG: hypothetical protein AAGE03_13620 [Pseudomonadota bacterium]